MTTLEDPAAWIGRIETADDEMAVFPALAAAATFGDAGVAPSAGAPLPPLWHWFYFLRPELGARLGVDGHPARGDFLPPIALPRRMFAGARIVFRAPVLLGRPARRDSAIASIKERTGGSGPLAFVTVRHVISQDNRPCIEEEQDIVYRDAAGRAAMPTVTAAPPPEDAWRETITPDPVLLFRFSALTFNAHRIHYDQAYATRTEGYPGLVVHGPLTAMLLLALIRRETRRPIAGFTFRGLAPAFAGAPLCLTGRPRGDGVALEARDPAGVTVMTADAALG